MSLLIIIRTVGCSLIAVGGLTLFIRRRCLGSRPVPGFMRWLAMGCLTCGTLALIACWGSGQPDTAENATSKMIEHCRRYRIDYSELSGPDVEAGRAETLYAWYDLTGPEHWEYCLSFPWHGGVDIGRMPIGQLRATDRLPHRAPRHEGR